MSFIQTGRPGRWLSAGIAVVGLVLLAGCGSSAESTDTTGATTTTTADSGRPAADEYASCMAENGVTIEQPSGGAPPSDAPRSAPSTATGELPPAPEGVDEDTWEVAFGACKVFMPSPPSGAAPPTARK